MPASAGMTRRKAAGFSNELHRCLASDFEFFCGEALQGFFLYSDA